MLPNKFILITNSKIYRAILFYRDFPGLLIHKSQIKRYEEIESLTILYSLGYIKNGGVNYFVKIR